MARAGGTMELTGAGFRAIGTTIIIGSTAITGPVDREIGSLSALPGVFSRPRRFLA